MIQIILNIKAWLLKILTNERMIVIISVIVLIYFPISYKNFLEKKIGKSISIDVYMLLLNILVNSIGAIIIYIFSKFVKELPTQIVTKTKNRKLMLIDYKPQTFYLDIFAKKMPINIIFKFLFNNIYLKLKAPDWVELTSYDINSEQQIKNEILIPLGDYLGENIRLQIELIKSTSSKEINRNKDLTSEIVFRNEKFSNIFILFLLILLFKYESIKEDIELVIKD